MVIIERECIDCKKLRKMYHNAIRCYDCAKNRRKKIDKFIEEKWEEFTDDQPLQYFFLDERLESFYAEEKRTGSITLIFSILAIFIASLGLFGLTLYNSQKRIREIGIRKALGASMADARHRQFASRHLQEGG